MKTLYISVLVLILFLFATVSQAETGGGGGNGGDPIRMGFIDIGNNVISYYKKGFSKISDQVADPELLRTYLTINVIKNSLKQLYDNQNNPVGAIGVPNSITLFVGDETSELSWSSILKNKRKSEKMVLHEMLRAHGVNDDNYFYSNIVLTEQDIVEGQKYKMRWSLDLEATLQSTLGSSFTKTGETELEIYETAINKIQSYRFLEDGNLLLLPLELSRALEQNSGMDKRRDLKTTLSFISVVDAFSASHIREGFDVEKYKKIVTFILRNMTLKMSNEKSSVGQLQPFLNLLIDEVNSREDFRNRCDVTMKKIKQLQDSTQTKEQVIQISREAVAILNGIGC